MQQKPAKRNLFSRTAVDGAEGVTAKTNMGLKDLG